MNRRLPGDVEMSSEIRKGLVREITAFFDAHFEEDVSDFRSEMILDFFLERLSPVVYNTAITDARSFLAERLEDMEATLYAKTPRR